MPKVSVVLTTYNRAELLPQAIESVLSQTFQDWELLVIDDGSTDKTPEVLRNFARQDSRVKFFRQENRGVAVSRGFGVKKAAGAYLAFLDDDDVYYPNKLTEQVAFLEKNTNADLVYSYVNIRGEKGNLPDLWPPEVVLDFEGLLRSCTIQTNTALVRASAFERWGNFGTNFGGNDDHEMWLRIALYGKIEFLPIIVGEYRWHTANMSRNIHSRFRNENRVYWAFLNRKIGPKHARVIRSEGSVRNYLRASDSLDRGDFKMAAKYYFDAIAFDPFVGISIPWNKGAGKPYRFLRPYLGFLLSSIKSVSSARTQ